MAASASAAAAAAGVPQKQLLSIIRDFAAEKSHGAKRALAPKPYGGVRFRGQHLSDGVSSPLCRAESTVSGLKRRLDDMLAAADAAAAELEAAKRAREAAAEELSGTQEQAAIAAASIQALEDVLVCMIGIGNGGDVRMVLHVMAQKSEGDSERDEFFSQMHELSARIRQFQQMASVELAEKCSGLASADGHHVSDKKEIIDSEGFLKDLVDKVSNIDAEVHFLDGE